MSLKAVHDSIDEIPEAFRELYAERAGKFELTGVQGVKSQADVDRLQSALEKERNDHKGTKEKFSPFAELDSEEIFAKLDRIPELEALAADKIDDAQLQEMADRRAQTLTRPVERKMMDMEKQLSALMEENIAFKRSEQDRLINNELLKAGREAKLLDPEDAIAFGRMLFTIDDEGNVLTEDGRTAEQFVLDLQDKKPHLSGTTLGGGARGGSGGAYSGSNPFSNEHWNMGEQKTIYDSNPDKASQLAKMAGTTVGGLKPAPRR